jgi:hypothetical protein
MTFDEMANFRLSIKVSDAYNLDGGGSTTMVVKGKVVNYLSGGEHSVATTLQVVSGWVWVRSGAVSDSARVVVLKPQTGVAPPLAGSPFPYSLEQNYPNPFNPTTTIEYSLPHQVRFRLTVCNLVGREVTTLVNELQSAGSHAVRFDASTPGSGTYFYQIVAGEQRSTRKFLLLK